MASADNTTLISVAITAVSTLSAVLITSLFNIWLARINFKSQGDQKRIERKMLKIEEFFLLFEKWQANVSQLYLLHLRCYYKKITYVQVQDLLNDSNKLVFGELQTLQMLLHIHFPSLKSAYQHVDDARSRLVPYLSDPNKSKLSVKDFDTNLDGFDEACKEFKIMLSNLAQKL